MRKSYLFLFLLSLIALIFFVGKSDSYAACGGAWFSNSCPTTPYPQCNNKNCDGLKD